MSMGRTSRALRVNAQDRVPPTHTGVSGVGAQAGPDAPRDSYEDGVYGDNWPWTSELHAPLSFAAKLTIVGVTGLVVMVVLLAVAR